MLTNLPRINLTPRKKSGTVARSHSRVFHSKRGTIAMAQKQLRVGLIGTQFMGKAHSNAWSQVNHFFDTPTKAVLAAVCGRNEERAKSVAATWGWQSVETDWHN